MHKVYTNRPDHFFYYNVKMTADYCNFPIETIIVDQETQDSKDFKAKKAHGKFPFMETPAGDIIFESSAIAAYIAREAGNQAFLGASAYEESQVNQWVAFTSANLVPNFYKIALHTFGWVDNKAAGYVKWVGAGNEQASAPAAGGKAAKGGKKDKKAPAPKKEEKKATPAAAAADEDDFDPFAEDPEADAAAAAAIKAKEAEAKDKKKKAAPIAKSIILWEIKPWGEETNLDELAQMVLGITMDGLVWKTEYKKEPVAFGIFKLIMGAVVEDDKVSTDIVEEKVVEFEDHVQSIDIISFNKL